MMLVCDAGEPFIQLVDMGGHLLCELRLRDAALGQRLERAAEYLKSNFVHTFDAEQIAVGERIVCGKKGRLYFQDGCGFVEGGKMRGVEGIGNGEHQDFRSGGLQISDDSRIVLALAIEIAEG